MICCTLPSYSHRSNVELAAFFLQGTLTDFSSFFPCTRAWKTMQIQQCTGLLYNLQPIIVFAAINTCVAKKFFRNNEEKLYRNTDIEKYTEKNECYDSSSEICLRACCHLHNCRLISCIFMAQICCTSANRTSSTLVVIAAGSRSSQPA